MQEEYNNLLEKFSNLDKNFKRKEIIGELQVLLGLFHKLCENNNSLLINNKMKKLEKNNISEDEYLDGIYSYIISIKDKIGLYYYSNN